VTSLTSRMRPKGGSSGDDGQEQTWPASLARRSVGDQASSGESTSVGSLQGPGAVKGFIIAAVLLAGVLGSASTGWAQPSKGGGDQVLRTPPASTAPERGAGNARSAETAPGGRSDGGASANAASDGSAAQTQGTPGPTAAPGPAGSGVGAAILKGGIPEITFAPKPVGALVSFSLDEADLPELVKAISNLTGRRFIYGGKLRQIKASVYAPDKVTVAEAYAAFLSILQSNGLTVIPCGRFLKVIESGSVESQTTPVAGTATPVPDEDRYMTRLYRVSNASANDVAAVLGRFKTKEADITVYEPTGLLIITDTGTNIRRLLRIVEELDVPSAGDQIWMQPIHHRQADELAAELSELIGTGGGGGKGGRGGTAGQARILSDPRNNQLVIVASETDYLRLLELIKRVDVPDVAEGGVHVLGLQHAQCDELSKTLNEIMGGSRGAGRGARGKTPAATLAGAAGGAEAVFEGQVTVACDSATNSLITTSSLRDYAALRNVVDQLDRPRRQVFIEAVIMDVNVDHATDLGVGYHAGGTSDLGGSGPTTFYGGVNAAQSMTGVPANLEALAFGVKGPDLEGTSNLLGTGISIPGFSAVLHAAATSGDSNVLATPHVLATDNIPAEINIGQNIPLQTNVGGSSSLAGLASSSDTSGLTGLSGLLSGSSNQAAPRQDVGIKLNITPHINDSDQVRMELKEEFSDAGAAEGALGAVPINKRTASTTVIVRDQQTVVIGGLVREMKVDGETKVPVLGDIPVLGILFRQSQKKTQKTDLLLILTPHIIRDQNDLRRIFEQKMQQRQEFIDRYTVFESTNPWEPPPDYTRTNGLLEHIRRAQLRELEHWQLAEKLKPKSSVTHEPTKPIPLPSIGAKGGGSSSAQPTSAGRTKAPSPTGDPSSAAAPAPSQGAGRRRDPPIPDGARRPDQAPVE
jgi:general secretion pathway protein D